MRNYLVHVLLLRIVMNRNYLHLNAYVISANIIIYIHKITNNKIAIFLKSMHHPTYIVIRYTLLMYIYRHLGNYLITFG